MTLQYKKLTEGAYAPARASTGSIGYDLYTPIDFVLPPGAQHTIFLDIALGIPKGHYGRIASKSGLAVKYQITTRAGVIDRDYTGNVGVVLRNESKENFTRKRGDPIAQLILEKASLYPLEEVLHLEPTQR